MSSRRALSEDEVRTLLGECPSWRLEGIEIVRRVRSATFLDAIDLVRQVAALAEAADHHPDMLIQYRDVTFRLTTHDAGGLTRSDLALASAIDALPGVSESG